MTIPKPEPSNQTQEKIHPITGYPLCLPPTKLQKDKESFRILWPAHISTKPSKVSKRDSKGPDGGHSAGDQETPQTFAVSYRQHMHLVHTPSEQQAKES